jgi:hypothetical protein
VSIGPVLSSIMQAPFWRKDDLVKPTVTLWICIRVAAAKVDAAAAPSLCWVSELLRDYGIRCLKRRCTALPRAPVIRDQLLNHLLLWDSAPVSHGTSLIDSSASSASSDIQVELDLSRSTLFRHHFVQDDLPRLWWHRPVFQWQWCPSR